MDNGIIYFLGFGSKLNFSTTYRIGLMVTFAKLVASTFHALREILLILTFLFVGIITQNRIVKKKTLKKMLFYTVRYNTAL